MTDLLLQEAEQAVLPAAREGRHHREGHPHQQEEQRRDPHAVQEGRCPQKLQGYHDPSPDPHCQAAGHTQELQEAAGETGGGDGQ